MYVLPYNMCVVPVVPHALFRAKSSQGFTTLHISYYPGFPYVLFVFLYVGSYLLI